MTYTLGNNPNAIGLLDMTAVYIYIYTYCLLAGKRRTPQLTSAY